MSRALARGSRFAGRLRGVWTSVVELDRVELCGRLTLLLIACYPPDYWYARYPLLALAIVGALTPKLRAHGGFWLGVTLVVAYSDWVNWYSADNHKYLLAYWCLALACCRLSPEPTRALATSARWLLALVFLLATGWKAVAPDFLDGSFFHATLLLDHRFAPVATWVGGYTASMIELNDAARTALLAPDSELAAAQLVSTDRIASLAQLLTWPAIGLELAIGLLFLLPRRVRAAAWGDWALIAFLVTTYALASVVGFGTTLAILGIAQVGDRPRPLALYAVALVLVQLYQVPWLKLAERLF